MEQQPKRPRGRPRLADPASVRVNFRATPGEREKYKRAAARAGVTLTVWLKSLADRDS